VRAELTHWARRRPAALPLGTRTLFRLLLATIEAAPGVNRTSLRLPGALLPRATTPCRQLLTYAYRAKGTRRATYKVGQAVTASVDHGPSNPCSWGRLCGRFHHRHGPCARGCHTVLAVGAATNVSLFCRVCHPPAFNAPVVSPQRTRSPPSWARSCRAPSLASFTSSTSW
jgi:hypothetical protein